jgi:hypothetical protein
MWSEPLEEVFKLCFSLVLFNARATYTPTITGLISQRELDALCHGPTCGIEFAF